MNQDRYFIKSNQRFHDKIIGIGHSTAEKNSQNSIILSTSKIPVMGLKVELLNDLVLFHPP
jgi:hypothetical protein